MDKQRTYASVRFSAETIKRAHSRWQSFLPAVGIPGPSSAVVWIGDSRWGHDNEAEFYADYRRAESAILEYALTLAGNFGKFSVQAMGRDTTVTVALPERHQIESVFADFDDAIPQSLLASASPETAEPVIFIGHGRSSQWRDLKDHLEDQHGYDLVAYEVGARAGHTIRDILEKMLSTASMALIVMTGEDEDIHGGLHARENVIHEAGLFQGTLGFARAIILLEEGTTEFSNIHGLQQIRFSRGNIRETFGDVLATLRREFHRPTRNT